MELHTQPFSYFIWNDFASNECFGMLKISMQWLEWDRASSAEYLKLSSTNKSTMFVINEFKQNKIIFDTLSSQDFLSKLNTIFNTHVTRISNIVFLKMSKGFFNHIHSDENNFGELVRIILYISSPDDYKGGELVLHRNRQHSSCVTHKFPANTLFGFKMGGGSYHSVNKIISGFRLCASITYS